MQSVPASTDTTRFYTEHWPTRGLRQTGPGGAEGGNPTSRRHHARLKDAGSSPGLSTPAPCPRAAGNSPGGRALTAGPSAVLTLSYQQRMLSWPHMQLLEEQSSMQTQYWGGGGGTGSRSAPSRPQPPPRRRLWSAASFCKPRSLRGGEGRAGPRGPVLKAPRECRLLGRRVGQNAPSPRLGEVLGTGSVGWVGGGGATAALEMLRGTGQAGAGALPEARAWLPPAEGTGCGHSVEAGPQLAARALFVPQCLEPPLTGALGSALGAGPSVVHGCVFWGTCVCSQLSVEAAPRAGSSWEPPAAPQRALVPGR